MFEHLPLDTLSLRGRTFEAARKISVFIIKFVSHYKTLVEILTDNNSCCLLSS